MTRSMRLSSWPAALCSGILLVGCAPQSEFDTASTSPVTLVCDGGRTFTVAYANNFDTAIVEAEGQRLELPRVYTAASLTPTPPEFGRRAGTLFDRDADAGFDDREESALPRGDVSAAGSTGVRYGNDEALFVSRNRAAVLQVGDDTYSNCEVTRT